MCITRGLPPRQFDSQLAGAVKIQPDMIVIRGIDTIKQDCNGHKLIARAKRCGDEIIASVAPEVPPPGSSLREAKGAENRIELELKDGQVIRLRGQVAGRWPAAVSVVGDLREVARLVEFP